MNEPNVSPTESADIDLAQLDEDFAAAEVDKREFDEVPDGKYQVTVDRVELARARTSGNALLRWTLKILNGPHAGRLLWRNNVMVSRDNLRFLKTDLHVCGLDLEKLSDLPASLDKLLDVQLEVTRKTKGENTNVYFNRRIVLAGAGAAANDSDTPF